MVGELPSALKQDAEMYAGCVAGAIQKSDYLKAIEDAGFQSITIQKEKPIVLPDDILEKYLSAAEIEKFKNSNMGIFSISVYADKPGEKTKKQKLNLVDLAPKAAVNCEPNTGCC